MHEIRYLSLEVSQRLDYIFGEPGADRPLQVKGTCPFSTGAVEGETGARQDKPSFTALSFASY
jgi:hypothetical protein